MWPLAKPKPALSSTCDRESYSPKNYRLANDYLPPATDPSAPPSGCTCDDPRFRSKFIPESLGAEGYVDFYVRRRHKKQRSLVREFRKMKCFMRVGSIFLGVFGVLVGFGILLGPDVDLLQICGRNCGLIKAFIRIFGSELTKIFIASIWIAVGISWVFVEFRYRNYK